MAWLLLEKPTLPENQSIFNTLESLANGLMAYPNAGSKTQRYAIPHAHPNGVFLAFPVQGLVEETYHNDPAVKAQVDAALPNALSYLVATLPNDWLPIVGDS